MDIPENITKEHLLQAIDKIDEEGIPSDGDSQYYDVVFNKKRYPPKLIVSYANLYANGEILERKSFSGGMDTACFKLLKDNDFVIEPKLSSDKNPTFFLELKKFITQAIDGGLKTSHYQKEYSDLNVKVSFGQGTQARVPWISFLGRGQTTSDGIYPVYLLYKNIKKLILAYGVSETNPPQLKWNTNELTVGEYFSNNNLGDPRPYPNSFVFKVYDINSELSETEINNDLNELILIYKETLKDQDNIKNKSANKEEKMPIGIQMNIEKINQKFNEDADQANLYFNDKLGLRFIASLLTKPFVILTGLSGSGKTKLAQAFTMWISLNESQYCIVPVGADWTNREPLLGFPNALKERDYVKPDNRVLDLILDANNNLDKPYFLILDEMNLSHVERYFADFLSVMESKSNISLHPGNEEWNGIPSKIGFPNNLFIIGTVNIDETTYMFSPKVLDRANVIEFRVSTEEMNIYLDKKSNIDLEYLKRLGSSFTSDFIQIALDKNLQINDTGDLNEVLINFFKELKKTGAEFGYRSASEIIRFVAVIKKLGSEWSINEIIDIAIMQKLLPKVHGSRRKLEPVLKSLGELCLEDGEKFDEYLLPKSEVDFLDNPKIIYPVAFEKILRMYDNLISNGFTSYAEA